MTLQNSDLADLGWSIFFSSQLDLDDVATGAAVRVMAVHRHGLSVIGAVPQTLIPPFTANPNDPVTTATVGDWLLLDRVTLQPQRLLDRKSLFKRHMAGTGRQVQLIAANVDTLLIVSSCNQDFSAARLERYLALARETQVTPVIVLTKADLTEAADDFARDAAKLMPGLLVEVVDARDTDSVACLRTWCATGQTVAFVGSSGVGKSTLINTLCGDQEIATQAVREDDAKGRHTTTARSLHRLPAGGLLLDTPGMRELGLADVKAGIDDVFADIVGLTEACRFADCRHTGEPGCAVAAAVETGTLESARLKRWRKLVAEEAHNSATVAVRRSRDKAFGKMVKGVMKDKRRRE